MTSLNRVCPHIPSSDPDATKAFFCDVLGFNVAFEYENYAELEREGHIIGIQQSQGKPNQQSLYFRMDGVNDLWVAQKEKIAEHKHREPFEQDYGMREIHVVLPGTATLLFIGERI